MSKHLVLVTDFEFEEIVSGSQKYLVRFFKKRPEFLGRVELGDVVYFKKSRGEILGQFLIGNLAIFEGVDSLELERINKLLDLYQVSSIKYQGKERKFFKEGLRKNRVLIIIRILKLEQFITSPLEMPKIRKEWAIIEE